jgi:hypothetical protein
LNAAWHKFAFLPARFIQTVSACTHQCECRLIVVIILRFDYSNAEFTTALAFSQAGSNGNAGGAAADDKDIEFSLISHGIPSRMSGFSD